MKKTFLQHVSVLGLFITGLLLFGTASDVAAQSPQTLVSNSLYSPDKGPYVGSSQAMELLEGKLAVIKESLSGMTEGTTQFNQALARYNYFSTIYEMVEGGKSVSDAIVEALKVAGTDKSNTQNYLSELKQEAINLLKA